MKSFRILAWVVVWVMVISPTEIQNREEKQVWNVEDKFGLKCLCDGQEALSRRICEIKAEEKGHK